MYVFCKYSSYELDNGQLFSETGELRTFGEQQAVVKSGAYSFVGADGQTYWVTYTADENGFHPIIGMLCVLHVYKYYWMIIRLIEDLVSNLIEGTGPGGPAAGQDASFDNQQPR